MSNNIRKESTKNKFMMNKEKINFIPYWDFLKLIPSYKGSKEALLLAFLIDEDGKDYNRHPDNTSWFKCSRGMMCEAINVSLTAIDRYLDNLQFWGFIKYEAIQLPKSPVCTYIELQGELIEKLAIYYNKLIEEKKYDEITSISSCDRYMYRNKIDIYIITIQTPISSCDNSNNSNNNTINNSVRENPTPISVLEENNIDKDKPRKEWGVWEDGMFHYHSIVVPKHFNDYLLQKKEWSEKILKQKLKYLEGYLVQFPKQRYWVSTTPESYANLLDSAYAFMTAPASEKETRLG